MYSFSFTQSLPLSPLFCRSDDSAGTKWSLKRNILFSHSIIRGILPVLFDKMTCIQKRANLYLNVLVNLLCLSGVNGERVDVWYKLNLT